VNPLHVAVGFSIVGAFALLMLWGLVAWILRKPSPGRVFWWLLTYVQVTIIVQLAVGLVLLATGGRRPVLHYVYGAVFPGLLLVTAHVLARERFQDRPWAVFAAAGFFCFGLTLRALQTGFLGA